MILTLDHRSGRAQFGDVGLAAPTFRQWAEWSMAWEHQAADLADSTVMIDEATARVVLVDGLPWEDHPAHRLVAALARDMLTSLGAPIPLDDDSWDLLLADRGLIAQLLRFWRDVPLSPWDPDGVGAADKSDKERRIIRSSTPGIRGAMSVVYRALGDHDPLTIDRLELWQIATLLGRDDPEKKAEWDEKYHGARTRRNVNGNREYMGFRRHPAQKFLFSRPPQITMN